MFRFGYPIVLWALVLIPVLLVLYLIMMRINHKQLAVFSDKRLLHDLMPNYVPSRRHIKFIIFILALALLILAATDPQIGSKLEKVKHKGAEVIVALDVSNSMLAEDVFPSRIEAAKMALEKLVDRLDENDIGVIVFAGDAFVQLPVTSDYVSAKMFLSSINTSLVSIQGTNISKAIELATRSFSSQDKETSKVLIIISDGEDHEEGAVDMASEAAKKGVIIHTIGMGKPEGAPIPVFNKFGKKDFKTDKDGNVIISKTNDALLQQIASSANGVYVRAQNSSTILNEIAGRIEKLSNKETESQQYSDYDHQFQYPLALAILLFIFEFFFIERKFSFFSLNLRAMFSSKVFLLLAFILLLPVFSKAQPYKNQIREGTNLYLKKKFKESEVAFRKAYKLNPTSYKTTFNLGDALYKQEKFDDAEKQFQEAQAKSKLPEEQAHAYYNLGNTYLKKSKLDESIESYKNALRRNPNDTQTKYNLSYAMMLKKQQQQQQKQNQNKKQQQNKQQQNKQQNKQDQQKQQQKQQQQEKPKISKEDANRMLQALQNDENNRQEKLKKQQIATGKRTIDKDW